MISVEDIRSRMRTSAEVEVATIAPLCVAAIAAWESATGRIWNYRTGHTQRWTIPHIDPRETLWLELYPLETISVKVWNRSQREADAETISADDLDAELDIGAIRLVGSKWSGCIKATMTGGYTNLTCPPDVREALITQVTHWFHRNSPDNVAVTSKSVGPDATTVMAAADYCELFKATARSRMRLVS